MLLPFRIHILRFISAAATFVKFKFCNMMPAVGRAAATAPERRQRQRVVTGWKSAC